MRTKNSINPEIKEFFETFHGKKAKLSESGFMYHLELDSGGSVMVALKYGMVKLIPSWKKDLPDLNDEDWVYPFNGKLNDEATMLKYLKLKAFL